MHIEINFNKMIKSFFAFCFVAVLIIFVTGNSDNPDIFAAMYYYNHPELKIDSVLMELIRKLLVSFGVDYYVFRVVSYAIGFAFLLKAISFANVKKYQFFLLYMIFPMMFDGTQMENFIAMSILTYGLVTMKDTTVRERTRLFAFILLASGFHTAMLFFLPFPLIKHQYSKKTVISVAGIIIILSVFGVLFRNELLLMARVILNMIFPADIRIEQYLTSSGKWGFIIYWAMHLMLLFISIRNRKQRYEYEDNQVKISGDLIINIASNIMLYTSLALPLYSINSNFFRLTRNSIPTVILATLLLPKNNANKRKNLLTLIILLVIMEMVFIYFPNNETIFDTFFTRNFILFGN